MIDKRIKHYQKENARLFELLNDEKLLQKQDVIIKTINEHEAVIRELKHIKKLSLGNVSNLFCNKFETKPDYISSYCNKCGGHFRDH